MITTSASTIHGALLMATYTDVLGGFTDDAGYKAPCVAATTTDLGTALSGLLVIDGVQTNAGDRVLVWHQIDQTTNGIYTVSTGAWSRSLDFASSSAIFSGTQVYVSGGNNYANTTFVCGVTNPTVGTTAITFTQSQSSSGGGSATPYREIVSGSSDVATTSDGYIVWNSASGAPKAQSIPAASSFSSGYSMTIKDAFGDAGVNPITITPATGTIDGAASYVLNSVGSSITLVANKGTNVWRKV